MVSAPHNYAPATEYLILNNGWVTATVQMNGRPTQQRNVIALIHALGMVRDHDGCVFSPDLKEGTAGAGAG